MAPKNELPPSDLLTFLSRSPTPFHAVKEMTSRLENAGFQALNESDAWTLSPGQGYFVTRNDSSIIAFYHNPDSAMEGGIHMVGAHTDSPCLRVKSQPEIHKESYGQLGVETYGGVLLAPWFDRDLSIAGRVNYRNTAGEIVSSLIDFERAIAVVPNLAIHLNRDANSKHNINAQQYLPPVLMQIKKGETFNFRDILKTQLVEQGISDCAQVLDFELSLYDTQAPAVIGFNSEFIASARLDNLLSCYTGLQALLSCEPNKAALLVCNDHEEVGSVSACGAQGPMLDQCLQRLYPDTEQRLRIIARSMMISADNAHGVHPNYSDKHDPNHGPQLNAGPVIKVNANQRYATNSDTSSLFKDWCDKINVPVQTFINRTDLGCGSTIGPITSAEVGVKTLDVGVPTFAMHSIRELAGVKDTEYLLQVLTYYLMN